MTAPTAAETYAALTPELIHRLNRRGPRYTSYPTVPVWATGEFEAERRRWLARERERAAEISLYLHLPFCRRLCTFCGCNQRVTRDRGLMARYLAAVEREAAAVAALTGPKRVRQLHLGGGTPTWYEPAELDALIGVLGRHFELVPDGEYAVEVHPKVTTREHLAALAGHGFRRLSLGVQDLNPEVQRAINREQTFAETAETTAAARALGYTSVNFDLVYGLPKQNLPAWRETLAQVDALRPDRLAVYSFAYIPGMFKTHERAIHAEDLPPPELKTELYLETIRHFTGGGYEMIGMDHYALPEDELARAVRTRTLHRNFMGYTTLKGLAQLGLGVSAISDFGDGYFQNPKDLETYLADAEAGRLTAHRHAALDADDRLRRDLIEGLLCHGELSWPELAATHGPGLPERFAPALDRCREFAADGLLDFTPGGLRLTPLGRLFPRVVAMPFDRYLDAPTVKAQFSATV